MESTEYSETDASNNADQSSTNNYVDLSTTDIPNSSSSNSSTDSEEHIDVNIKVTSDGRIEELTTASLNDNSSNSVTGTSPMIETSTQEDDDVASTSSEEVTAGEESSEARNTIFDTDSARHTTTTHTTAETTTDIGSSYEETVKSTNTINSNAVDNDTGSIDIVSIEVTSQQNEERVISTVGFSSEQADVFNSTNSSPIDNDKTASTRMASTGEFTTDPWVSEISEITTETSGISSSERDQESTTITTEAGDVSSPETEYESTTTTTTFPVSHGETDESQNFIFTSIFDDNIINYTLSLPEVSI